MTTQINQMDKDEQIAIEVLETILNENPNPKTLVSTTMQNFTFTYEDLMSTRINATIIKKKLNSQHEIFMFNKLRRRLLSRKYSKRSRSKKRTEIIIVKTERDLIVDKAFELFTDHPKFSEFRDFITKLKDSTPPPLVDIIHMNDSDADDQSSTHSDLPDLIYIPKNI